MPTLPLTERAAMARGIAASRVSSVLSGVRPGQRTGVAVRSAATIPARTSGGRLAHAATKQARSASGGAWPPPASGRDAGGTGPRAGPPVRPRPAPRLAPGAVSAAPGAARSSESAYSPGDSASARGFDSPRLHSIADTGHCVACTAAWRLSLAGTRFPSTSTACSVVPRAADSRHVASGDGVPNAVFLAASSCESPAPRPALKRHSSGNPSLGSITPRSVYRLRSRKPSPRGRGVWIRDGIERARTRPSSGRRGDCSKNPPT